MTHRGVALLLVLLGATWLAFDTTVTLASPLGVLIAGFVAIIVTLGGLAWLNDRLTGGSR